MGWIVYAVLETGRLQPLITNSVGAVLAVFYISVFLVYHEKRDRRVLIGKLFVLCLCSALVAALAEFGGQSGGRKRAAQFMGLCATVVNGVMYGAPLSVMCLVVRTSSV